LVFRIPFLHICAKIKKGLGNLIRIGTRGSDLALWQANYVAKALSNLGQKVAIETIRTKGDKIQTLSFDKIEGKGFFTKELEEALSNEHIDIAVHSMKDLPTEQSKHLAISGVSERSDPSDWLLIHPTAVDDREVLMLKHNAAVGTSSVRRKSQMKALRPDILSEDLRGNVPTRIQKLRDRKVDSIVLAAAGIVRLGLDLADLHIVKLNPKEFVPAPAQGVLAYQSRKDDLRIRKVLQRIHHPQVSKSTNVERSILQLLGGGCHLPMGAYCQQDKMGYFHVWATYAATLDEKLKRANVSYNTMHGLAEAVVEKLNVD